MKILGIVILFHPADSVINNIESYSSALDKLIIWDNTPNHNTHQFASSISCEVMVWGEGKNVGLGKPMNMAARYAQENGYDYLLTMDQDSCFDKEEFNRYKNWAYSLNKMAILSPNYRLNGELLHDPRNMIVETDVTMTSGSIYPVGLFNKIGFFRDDFFIDSIDTEYSLRAFHEGIPTIINTSVVLNHGWGYRGEERMVLFGIRFTPNNYSAVRTYYIIRNGLITKKSYPNSSNWKTFMRYWVYKRMVLVLLFEKEKWRKLKAIFWGVVDGINNVTGEQNRV